MIQGVVTAALEPTIRLSLQGPTGESRELEAVVDTGYNGYLTLPPALASALALPFVTANPALLADGSEAVFEVYRVTVLWDGHFKDIDVHISDATPLVGMRLLDSYSLYVEVEIGGRVVIEAR